MRAPRSSSLLTAGLLLVPGLILGCRASGSMESPSYPTSTAEIRRVIDAAAGTDVARTPDRRTLPPVDEPKTSGAPELLERVGELERRADELVGALASVDDATRSGSRAPESVGSAIAQSIREQREELRELRDQLELKLEPLPPEYREDAELAGEVMSLATRLDGIKAEQETALLQFQQLVENEYVTRIAENEARLDEVGVGLETLRESGGTGGAAMPRNLPWWIGGGALGLATLLAFGFSRSGRSRATDRIERLTNRVTDLDLRQRDIEERSRSARPIPLATGLAGAAVVKVSESPAAAARDLDTPPETEPAPAPAAESVEISAAPERAPEPPVEDFTLPRPETSSGSGSREDFDKSLVERIQEQYLANLEQKGTEAAGRAPGVGSGTRPEGYEPSVLDPPWKPLSPLSKEEEFRGRFEHDSERAVSGLGEPDDAGSGLSDEQPDADDQESRWV